MLRINIGKRAEKYLRTLPKKPARQISLKLIELQRDPEPHDSRGLAHSAFRRADIGEHRIVYTFSTTTLFVPLIGKRNDDDVYRRLRRMEG